jgi:UDP-N-acetylglucosamine 1-carboxyvinyltransferase
MDTIVICGGNPLSGEVTISGAKNAALPIMAATLLSSETHTLSRVPHVADLRTMQKLLRSIGSQIEEQDGALVICTPQVNHCEAAYEWVKTMRASILLLGPLLARCREAHVSLPGGCAIGARPIDLHLAGLSKMGAEIQVEHGMIHAKAKRLIGATISFEKVTVTGTENLMMAATLAEGTTILTHAAEEPEVIDLANFLNRCGAKITGHGTDRIEIEGVSALVGTAYSIIPDRIETGTFMVAAAITKGDLILRNCCPDHLTSLIRVLRKTGSIITIESQSLRIRGGKRLAVDIVTGAYPEFPTDMQAQMMALMTVSTGLSKMSETIFESRFNHAAELRRMGAKIYLEGHHAVIEGVPFLSGAPVMASDLRASSSLILAGLVAQGNTEISRVYHLDRGYERIEEKLSNVGAKITRCKAPAA